MNIAEHIEEIRSRFPALARRHGEREAVFFDGPAGTQVPQAVIDAIGEYLVKHNANCHGAFATSQESDRELDKAHQLVANFLGADDPDCVVFGANMTTLTLALARALSRSWQPGDEILLSGLEHDANFTPWWQAAEEAGAKVQVIDVLSEDCTLDQSDFRAKLSAKTKLVAVGCASNATGTVNPVAEMCQAAREVGATTFLDAVHYAPHDLIDVQAWGCDFLACSAYKFFGPHIGILWGQRPLLESIRPYKLRPSPESLPGRWMTGTQNHECIMGTHAAVNYIADLGRTLDHRAEPAERDAFVQAYQCIREYESHLCQQLLAGLAQIEGIKVWGITEPSRFNERLPTVSITHDRVSPQEIARKLGDGGVYVWDGNYYALPLTERIGVEPDGMVRIGLVHYNTGEEVQYFLAQLHKIVQGA